MRGAPGGRAVDRKRLFRLAVVGAVAIVAVVFLVPQIRDVADTDDADNAIPEGFDIYRAASNGNDVYGVGGELDGDTAHPRVFVFSDGEWELATTPQGVNFFGDVAVDRDRIAVAGSGEGGRAAVWTATLPDLQWEIEHHATPVADLRGIAIRGSTIVAVGSVLDTAGEALVLVRLETGWETATLPGGRVVPMAVVATGDGFAAAGSSAGAPAMWTSPDGLAWTGEQVDGETGSITALGVNGNAVMAIGTANRSPVAFAFGAESRSVVPLPTEDAGEAPFAITPYDGDSWVVVGQDIDVGDVSHAIMWTGDIGGTDWTLNERVAADRLSDVVTVDGRPFGVGSLERGGKLTPVLVPL